MWKVLISSGLNAYWHFSHRFAKKSGVFLTVIVTLAVYEGLDERTPAQGPVELLVANFNQFPVTKVLS